MYGYTFKLHIFVCDLEDIDYIYGLDAGQVAGFITCAWTGRIWFNANEHVEPEQLSRSSCNDVCNWRAVKRIELSDVLNIILAVFKSFKNCHPTIISPLCYCPPNQFNVQTSQFTPSSLIYWPETFSIFVIHWPTSYLCFSTQQWLIHMNKEKFMYLSPIGHVRMFTLNEAILEFLTYKLPISKFLPGLSICSLTNSPTLYPIPINLTTLYSRIINNNHIIYH